MRNNREELNRKLAVVDMNKSFVIFGAGKKGRRLAQTLIKYNILSTIIDNNVSLHGQNIYGVEVIGLDQYLSMREKEYIVICAAGKNGKAIAKLLEENGFVCKKDFDFADNFENEYLPMYVWNKTCEIFMPLSQIVLTERCTLKCIKCAHACHMTNKDSIDLTLEQAKRSSDYFFKNVDYVQEFVLIGGEPFLYEELSEIISYIGDKYRSKIGLFAITTNGTIIPKQKVLDACKKYNIFINISNYKLQIPRLENNYIKLEYVLKQNQIDYYLFAEETDWYDYGFGEVERNADEEQLIKVFDECKTPCHEVRENRLYYCVMARSVSDNLRMNIGKEDYFNLGNENFDRLDLVAFILGYSEKGYLDMCNFCRGKDAVNHLVPAAEQRKIRDLL